eukprot:gb/GECH01010859.1/.p1 GENE.gb/GECH01010859.1/~~gb/GECH01010859.1/.p1  ORF type:complete len:425 (+),score=80.37 gb/GECH01010859.1/:1-1275(+)
MKDFYYRLKSISSSLFFIFFFTFILTLFSRPIQSVTFSVSKETVFGWGRNNDFVIASSDFILRSPTQDERISNNYEFETVATGPGRVLAMNRDGEVFCWGENFRGECGPSRSILPNQISGLPEDKTIRSLHTGNGGSFALMTDGTLYAWGSTWATQGAFSESPVKLPFNDEYPFIKYVAARSSESYCLAIDRSGQAWIWGREYNPGKLDQDDNTKFVSAALDLEVDKSYLIDDQGQIWEREDSTQVTKMNPQPFDRVTRIAVGNDFILATDGNQIKAKGENSDGQLGIGSTYDSSTFQLVNIPDQSGIQKITATDSSSFALTQSGKLFGWGDSSENGIDSFRDQTTPQEITSASTEFNDIVSGDQYSFAQGDVPVFILLLHQFRNRRRRRRNQQHLHLNFHLLSIIFTDFQFQLLRRNFFRKLT